MTHDTGRNIEKLKPQWKANFCKVPSSNHLEDDFRQAFYSSVFSEGIIVIGLSLANHQEVHVKSLLSPHSKRKNMNAPHFGTIAELKMEKQLTYSESTVALL